MVVVKKHAGGGYILAETVLLGLLLSGLAASFSVWHSVEALQEKSRAEITAAYLAKECLAKAQAEARRHAMAASAQEMDVEKNALHFHLAQTLHPAAGCPSAWESRVQVDWQGNGSGSLVFHRYLMDGHE